MRGRPRRAEPPALAALVRRFGESVRPSLVNRGAVLGALNRPQDALEAFDEVVRRFGESETPALLDSVAAALGNRGAVLGALKLRPQDALEAWRLATR